MTLMDPLSISMKENLLFLFEEIVCQDFVCHLTAFSQLPYDPRSNESWGEGFLEEINENSQLDLSSVKSIPK